jgi:hypothetical protein
LKTTLLLLALVLALLLPFAAAYAHDKITLKYEGRVITIEGENLKGDGYDQYTKSLGELPQPDIVSMSPDKHWLFCFRHYGSHWSENYLYGSKDGTRFVPALKDFDMQAWKFFCKVEGVSRKDANIVDPAEFVSWTPDGSRLLFSLTSRLGLTDKRTGRPVPTIVRDEVCNSPIRSEKAGRRRLAGVFQFAHATVRTHRRTAGDEQRSAEALERRQTA